MSEPNSPPRDSPESFVVRLAPTGMSHAPEEIVVRLPGGRRVDASIGRHTVKTDQPVDNGGEDSAPSPFQLFLTSIATCAGIFVQGFCAKRDIPTQEISIVLRPAYGADGVLSSVDLDVRLPPSFPDKYREAILAVVNQCSVKKAIAAQPTFNVHATRAA